MCSSWHRRTPSRSACARSKTTAEGHTTRWLGGRTLQSMSQRPHCRHCSMAPAAPALAAAADGPAGSGQHSGQSAVTARHPARPRGARPPGRGFEQAAPGPPAVRPLGPPLPPPPPRATSGPLLPPTCGHQGARGAACRVLPSHTQVRSSSGPGSTPPAAAALLDPPLWAPHSALRASRSGRRSCPTRDKGAAGRSLPASGA